MVVGRNARRITGSIHTKRSTKSGSRKLLIAAAAAAAASALLSARRTDAATIYYWDPSGATGTWATSGPYASSGFNWSAGNSSGTGTVNYSNSIADSADFSSTAYGQSPFTVDVDSSMNVYQLNFLNTNSTNPTALLDTTNGPVTLTLGVAGGINVVGGVSATIGSNTSTGLSLLMSNSEYFNGSASTNNGNLVVNSPISANGSYTLNTQYGTVTFNGAITNGSGAVSLSLGGNTIIAGSNSYTGSTTVASNTTLQLKNLNAISSSSAINEGGAGLILDLYSDSAGAFTTAPLNFTGISNSATINVDHLTTGTGNTLTIGPMNFTNNAAVTTLTNGDGYNLSIGAVAANNTSNGGQTFTNNMSSGTTTIASFVSKQTSGSAGVLTFNGSSTTATTVIGAVTANTPADLSLVKAGSGTLILTGADTYTGATSVTGGALILQNSSALATGAAEGTISSGAALQLEGGITTASVHMAISGSGIGGNGAIENVSGTNTFAGAITLGAATTIGVDANSFLTLSNSAAFLSQVLTLTGAGTGTLGAGNQSASGMTVSGGGTWNLTGVNNSGILTVNSSTLNLAGSGSFAKYAINLNTSTFGESSGGVLSGASYVSVGNGSQATLLGTNTNTGSLNLASGGTVTLGNSAALGTGNLYASGGTVTANTNLSGGNKLASSGLLLGGTVTATIIGSNSIEFGGVSGETQSASGTIINNLSAGTLTLDSAAIATTATAGKVLTIGGTGNTSIGAISNGSTAAEGMLVSSTGITVLTAANSYTGVTILDGGTLDLGAAGTSSTAAINSASALTLGGGILKYTTTGSPSQSFASTTISTGASGVIAVAGNTINLAAISRTAGVGGTVDIGATGTVTTTTANTNGQLGLGITYGGNDWASANGSGPTYTIGAATYVTQDNAALWTANQILTDDGSGFSGTAPAITVSSVRFNGAASSAVTLAGTLQVNDGILETSNVGANPSTITGGTLWASHTNDFLIIQNNTSAGLTIASTIGVNGTSSLTKSGAGLVTLSGTNTYNSVTYDNAGILAFAKEVSLYNNVTSNWTAANLIVAPGATASFNVGGTGEFTLSDIGTLSGLGTGGSGFRSGSFIGLDTSNSSGGNFTYSNVLANPNSGANVLGLKKYGINTLTLSATNTYTGGTTVSGGGLVAGVTSGATNGAFGAITSTVTLGDVNTANNNSSPAVLINTGGFTVANPITVANQVTTGTYSIGGSNTSGVATYTGPITLNQPVTLVAATGGTAAFNPSAWTTNDKAISVGSSGNTGTVELDAALGTTSGIAVNYGALAVKTTFTGNATVGAAILSGTGTISGTTGVTGGTVTGTGLTLSGATTFNSTGNTLAGTVTSTSGVSLASGAVLALNGALTGAVSVGGSSATLNGNGSATGALSVLDGGIVHPGAAGGVGSLTTGAATFNDASSGSTLSITLNSDTPAASYLNVNGPVTLGTNNGVLLSVTDIGIAGNVLASGTVLPIITATGAITGNFSGLSASGDTVTVANGGSNVYTIEYSTNEVDLVANATPEPGSLSLLGIGSLALLKRRRRRVM